ncbi:urease accessory protein UreF [Lacrimispora sp.]|uniref:urease accessory protein UreF n=1 Tax=Lacrimispora sp. TaxID=2719234 RepID=UPI003994F031
MTGQAKDYLLMQINDALFPIGSYSHSFGLETYIQKGIIDSSQSAAVYLRQMLLYSMCQNELLTIRMAWEHSVNDDLDEILKLEELVRCTRTAMEIRQAGEKLGSRFIKTVTALPVLHETEVFQKYIRLPGAKSHTVAYGVFCAASGISCPAALKHYLYAQASAMVTNCVKTIPLSQMDGQKLLFGCQTLFDQVMERLEHMGNEELGAETPGFEIRCMQHEELYSRLYMS